jgi:hypothetical protein
MLRSNASSRSSRWLPPMISPIPGANTSIATAVRPSSFMPHVEGLDGLRVVHHDDWLLFVFLSQITFVLGLQVDVLLHREFEFLVRPAQLPLPPRVIDMTNSEPTEAGELR